MRLRDADAWGVARANAEAARTEAQNSESAKQERRDLNRRLAEKLVAGWSAFEYAQKLDAELQAALDRVSESFNPNQPKYRRKIEVQPQSFGADANAATAATEQRTKQRMTSFHSIRWNGESK